MVFKLLGPLLLTLYGPSFSIGPRCSVCFSGRFCRGAAAQSHGFVLPGSTRPAANRVARLAATPVANPGAISLSLRILYHLASSTRSPANPANQPAILADLAVTLPTCSGA